jgi:hypothetical protein
MERDGLETATNIIHRKVDWSVQQRNWLIFSMQMQQYTIFSNGVHEKEIGNALGNQFSLLWNELQFI